MNQKQIIQKVEKFVHENPPKNRGMRDIYLRHVMGVRKYALKLAKVYNADQFVVELAALLHDAAKDAGSNHAEEGAKLSQSVLKELGVPKKIRKQVSACIQTHSIGSQAETLEAQIIQDAESH
jgi:uncharacterized protein